MDKQKCITCTKCDGKGGYMEESSIEDRCYSSTSSGEFNGPTWVTCNWCGGSGKREEIFDGN